MPPFAALEAGLQAEEIRLPLERYRAALEALSPQLRAGLAEAWGAPEEDALCRDGAFHITGLRNSTSPDCAIQTLRTAQFHFT